MATTARHTTTLALTYALSAAESGFPVIPLSPNKLPALRSPHRGEPGVGAGADVGAGAGAGAGPGGHPCRGECGRPGHGVYDATTDPAGVRALFAAAPWATGYGIACGRAPHHLIGIDLDVTPTTGATERTGGAGGWSGGESGSGAGFGSGGGSLSGSGHVSWGGAGDPVADAAGNGAEYAPAIVAGPTPDSVAALQQLAFQHLFTLPDTVVVLTPSGGRHIWLSGPAGITVPNSASRLAPGIDVRGAGGYLVGPGSVSARGAYRLAPSSAGITPAPCPRALLRLLTPPERGRPAGPGSHRGRPAQGHGLVQFVLAAHAGQRNTRLFWAACRAYEHGFGDSLAEKLVDAAVRTGLTEHEARTTIASAARLTTPPRA
ncbi:bifunctional DNA primase/polymerase [Streptomyces sp. NBC_01498]|uniref:bifunctional DNA primase/polymerase n=1 Tax=Streptomyces sp. NBC_01498 TaxID=2975870 RepID=UPI002E7B0B71|nr:bifunctional DNA primase/polymerase [Streptomyces sp. NBC_01498]WTL25966.1 bifunctional DNA primase/polymerase [Streptomyces sp. NBC_01498]